MNGAPENPKGIGVLPRMLVSLFTGALFFVSYQFFMQDAAGAAGVGLVIAVLTYVISGEGNE